MKIYLLNFLLLGLLFTTKTVRADYSPTPLHYMALEAELIIQGEIDSIADNYFSVKVKNKVAGTCNDKTIKIKKFGDWTCAHRWTPYKKGQNAFLFLVKDAKNNWSVMSAGNEGEMPVMKENIYVYSHYCYHIPGIAQPGIIDLDGSKFGGVKFSLTEFTNAVKGLRTCFQLVKGENRSKDLIKQRCTNEALATYKNKSKLNGWFAELCAK